MSASLSTTCWHGLRLLQTKRLPKSSNVVPNWPTPETAEYVPRSGSKQKSRPLIETGFAPRLQSDLRATTSPPRSPLAM